MEVTKIIPGGFALATEKSGKKIFLWNALPGEIVTDYLVTKSKSSYMEAIALNISNPSPYRIEPKDNCFLSTSPWQILDYNYELKQKQLIVVELFREHGVEIELPEIITDYRDFFYRNKMEYALYYDHNDSKIHLAFHIRGTHRKTKVFGSSIEKPEIFAAATKIVADLNDRHEEARKYQSILLRCNKKGEVSGGLFENHRPHPVFDNLKDDILGHEYYYSPNGFFQINLPVYESVLKEIKKHIITDEVLDLYSGVGTIGLSVINGQKLTLVEVDKSAYKELENNCQLFSKSKLIDVNTDIFYKMNQKEESNINAILAKSEDVLSCIKSDQTVILDPPRAGVDRKLIDRLLEVLPPKIIYLSCNPATQARDVKMLLSRYHIDMIKVFNFFPRTPHIENLIVLSL